MPNFHGKDIRGEQFMPAILDQSIEELRGFILGLGR